MAVHSRLRSVAIRFALIVLGICVGSVLCEFGLRLVGAIRGINYGLYLRELERSDRLPSAMFDTTRPSRHRLNLRPGTEVLATTSDFSVIYTINEDGLRDKLYQRNNHPGAMRILALGDSLTFGEGVPYGDRFTDIPEHAVDGIEIINAGVPGWGLEDEWVYYNETGHSWSPDIVAVFLIHADLKRQIPGLMDSHGDVVLPPIWSQSVMPGGGETAFVDADDPRFTGERCCLLRYSRMLSYVAYQLKLHQLHARLEEQDSEEWGGAIDEEAMRANYRGDLDPQSPVARRAAKVAMRLLEDCEQHGSRLVIVNIDPLFQLGFFNKIDPRLIYVNMQPDLERRKERLCFKYDRHFNPATHAYIGSLLAEWIRTHLMRR